MFLLLGLEPEFLRGADLCVHWALSKNRGNRLRRQQIQIQTTRVGTLMCCCPLHSNLRHLCPLYTLRFVERQYLLLAAFHLIWLLLLFLITRIL